MFWFSSSRPELTSAAVGHRPGNMHTCTYASGLQIAEAHCSWRTAEDDEEEEEEEAEIDRVTTRKHDKPRPHHAGLEV